MKNLSVGDIVQNSDQRAIVRWIGTVEDMPMIGLQLIDSTLIGYTDGTCVIDQNRYFECPKEQGFYIMQDAFATWYKIVKEKKKTSSDDEFNSAEESFSTSPVNAFAASVLSPSQTTQPESDDDRTSPARGFLSRLSFERDQKQTESSPRPSATSANNFPIFPASVFEPEQPARVYHPEKYTSVNNENDSDELQVYEFTVPSSDDDYDEKEEEIIPPVYQLTNTADGETSNSKVSLIGHDYFLDTWTIDRVRSLVLDQISADDQICLNVHHDKYTVQNLIDEQVNSCCSFPTPPPVDIRIEIIKIFDNVEIVQPSRAIHLYDNDYLLLAILTSNNQCAYVRTTNGWAYTNDDNEHHHHPIVVEAITKLIDGDTPTNSGQCSHVLKNASFLYYKLVE